MSNEEKAQVMYEHILTDTTYNVLSNDLEIYIDFVNSLQDDDFNRIAADNIYFSVIYSPASNSILKVGIPVNAKVISFDTNTLKTYTREERIAVLLHEMGHALNPLIKGDESEYIADDFAILRGYGAFIKSSLEKNIKENPAVFDKEITRKRITRINDKGL